MLWCFPYRGKRQRLGAFFAYVQHSYAPRPNGRGHVADFDTLKTGIQLIKCALRWTVECRTHGIGVRFESISIRRACCLFSVVQFLAPREQTLHESVENRFDLFACRMAFVIVPAEPPP